MSGASSLTSVELWCDGACSGNGRESSAGGWAAVLIFDRPVHGAGAHAAASLLEREIRRLAEPGPISLDLGSRRRMRATAIWGNESPSTNNRMEMTGLLEGLNLGEELLVAAKPHQLKFTRVPGHSGVTLNELVDHLAVTAVRR